MKIVMKLMFVIGCGLNWANVSSGISVKIVTVLMIGSMTNQRPFLNMPKTSGANRRGLTGIFSSVIRLGWTHLLSFQRRNVLAWKWDLTKIRRYVIA